MKQNLSINESKCRICFSKNISQILDLGNQPLANNLIKNVKIKEKKFPLKIFFCNKCKAVQLSETINPKILFDNYFWTTSTSSTARNFSEKFYKKIMKIVQIKNPLIVEIASNDGTYLKPFKRQNRVIGIDPARNICKIANKQGIPTINSFFNLKTSKLIKRKYGQGNIIFARNVVAHVKNIHELIRSALNLISKDGIFAVEFHYAKKILEDLQYDSIYHEHIFYFSIESIKFLFKKHGFHLFDGFKSPISGGALVLIFGKNKKKISERLKLLEKNEKKSKVNSFATWKIFSKKVVKHSEIFRKTIEKIYNKNGKFPGYGASARSSTILNFAKISNDQLSFIVDKNPLKNNLYTPGSKIKIVNNTIFSKKIKKFDHILLLAWNFRKEILDEFRKKKYIGKIVLPLPKKTIIKNL